MAAPMTASVAAGFAQVPWSFELALLAVGCTLGLASGVIAFYLREVRRSLREDCGELAQELSGLRRDLARLEAALPEKYVLRDDFVRSVVAFDHKLDTLARELSLVGRNVTRLLAAGEDA